MKNVLAATALLLLATSPVFAAPISRSQAVKIATHDVANYPKVTVDNVAYDVKTGHFKVWMTSHGEVEISGVTEVDRVSGEFISSTFCGS